MRKEKKIDSLKLISLEDLLFRKSVPSKENLLGPGIKNKVALVTGAQDQLVQKISLQIFALQPLKIVAVDFSEPNLFALKNLLLKNKNIILKFAVN